ncbi:hypothetical protein [Azospirillum argentinense]|uniref:hypothetical protein n=1 Tax=Azospirillum argentinense TaxID=2970906 RepID=UPI0011AF0E40|nr:hypothetical protein [Azospirillum argentinense]
MKHTDKDIRPISGCNTSVKLEFVIISAGLGFIKRSAADAYMRVITGDSEENYQMTDFSAEAPTAGWVRSREAFVFTAKGFRYFEGANITITVDVKAPIICGYGSITIRRVENQREIYKETLEGEMGSASISRRFVIQGIVKKSKPGIVTNAIGLLRRAP